MIAQRIMIPSLQYTGAIVPEIYPAQGECFWFYLQIVCVCMCKLQLACFLSATAPVRGGLPVLSSTVSQACVTLLRTA